MDRTARIRIDKWLWHARFFKTRALAARAAEGGHIRLNGQRVTKPAHLVGPGDMLTLPGAGGVRLVRVLAVGIRRGPAPEAQTLYDEEAGGAAGPVPKA
ncbi:MAG: RNA-binding S4 domain-containing protein [Paracoccaceae bacterium]